MLYRGTTVSVDPDFGARIRQLRQQNAWSRQQLAQHLKDLDPNGQRLNSRTIARIETEQQDTIRQYSLQLLAQAFDSQPENLRNQTSISATDDPFFQLFQLQFRTIIDTEYS